MLMAGLDGIQRRIEPRSRSTRTSTTCPREPAKIPQVPASLDRALDALEADHEFLLAAACSPTT